MADAEARQRRIAILIVVLGLVIGLILLLLTQRYLQDLEDLIERDPEAGTLALIETIRWFVVLLVVPTGALLSYLAWYALRIIRSARFPPPGAWAPAQMAAAEGPRAQIRGWILALVTLLIALAVIQLALTLWSLADELARGREHVEPPESVEAAPF